MQRSRFWFPFVLGAALLLAQGCAPPQRVYSLDPVDSEGREVVPSRISAIFFEDDGHVNVEPGQTVRYEDGTWILEGPPEPDGTPHQRVIAVGDVSGLELREPDGEVRWVDVKTPDDLGSFQTLPRLDRITLRDGTAIDLDAEGLRSRWSANGLGIVLEPADRPEEILRTIPLDEVRSVRLHEPNLASATIRSPAFWVAGAAAVGLFVLIDHGRGPNDAVK